MHSLDIATSGSCLRNHLGQPRIHHPCPFRGNTAETCVFGKGKRSCSAWKVYIQTPMKPNLNHWQLDLKNSFHVMAIATFETKFVSHSKDGPVQGYSLELDTTLNSQVAQMLNDDSDKLDERERLRRQRISKANKGNVPWNKGRKHSAETLRRIRERTRLAMQNPKVKMKLVNMGHAQSEETRIKIGVGVRMGWQRRRERLMVQETCCLKWQNLIAEASRKGGYPDADELQWDSYEILDEQLKVEWLESIEKRKSMPRSKGSKRAPKSPEQRKKISEAISAKWANPEYRNRVCSALAKYHGTPFGAERKPRRKPSTEPSTVRRSLEEKMTTESYNSIIMGGKNLNKVGSKPKKINPPSYKDPLASSKLEMIKKLRAERVTMETKKMEAIERARLLIAEAEKAAKALEPAALTSSLARASLIETRKLIAEATHSLEAIEIGLLMSSESGNNNSSSLESTGVRDNFKEDPASVRNDLIFDKREVNGTHVLSSKNTNHGDLNFGEFALRNIAIESKQLAVAQSVEEIEGEEIPNHVSHLLPAEDATEHLQTRSELDTFQELGRAEKHDKSPPEYERAASNSAKVGASTATTTKKKWVCGRLVAVVEE